MGSADRWGAAAVGGQDPRAGARSQGCVGGDGGSDERRFCRVRGPGGGQTSVRLFLSTEPEGLVEKVGDKLNVVENQAASDLKRFKAFIESEGYATGAWRGGGPGGHVGTPVSKTRSPPAATRGRLASPARSLSVWESSRALPLSRPPAAALVRSRGRRQPPSRGRPRGAGSAGRAGGNSPSGRGFRIRSLRYGDDCPGRYGRRGSG